MTVGSEKPADPVWAAWDDLVAQFSFRRMLGDVFGTKAGWGMYGVDALSTLKQTKMAQNGLRVLAEAPAELLPRLKALAVLNTRRSEALWHGAALFYATVPVTAVLAGLEAMPDQLLRTMVAIMPMLIGTALTLTIWMVYFFSTYWRARQVEAVVELAIIERGGRS